MYIWKGPCHAPISQLERCFSKRKSQCQYLRGCTKLVFLDGYFVQSLVERLFYCIYVEDYFLSVVSRSGPKYKTNMYENNRPKKYKLYG